MQARHRSMVSQRALQIMHCRGNMLLINVLNMSAGSQPKDKKVLSKGYISLLPGGMVA